MTAPTTTNAARLTMQLEFTDDFGVTAPVLPPTDTEVAFSLKNAETNHVSLAANTKTLWVNTSGVTGIGRAVIVSTAATDLVITGGDAASTQKLSPNCPHTIGLDSGITQIQVTIASGTAEVKGWFKSA